MNRLTLLNFIFVLFYSSFCSAQTYPGLPTRSQNPLLQSYFIPATPVISDQKWSFSQSLYITNTYQIENKAQEELEIDVENTRLDFQVSYNLNPWYFNINLPYITNRSGHLDQTINNWHDFFHLPKGGRDLVENDLLRLYYGNDNEIFIDNRQSTAGLADVQFAIGYQLNQSMQVWIALELPSSSASGLISNQAVDAAMWLSNANIPFQEITGYFTLGLAFPANDGIFKDNLRNQFGFAQAGINYAINHNYELIFQSDFHTEVLQSTNLEALTTSLQGQFVLRINNLFEKHIIDLFFSEDIYPGHAPDITFGLRIAPLSNRN